MTGQPILANQFGSTLVLAVEIAFGANLAADPSTWTWTDVTADVRNANQVAMTVGRGDEASTPQPATCDFVLNNNATAYSKGPKSPHYPYVRRNTPVRVRAILSGTSSLRWQGYAVGFTPGWDRSTNDAIVTVKAAGSKRRLAQGKSPIQSTLTRSIPTLSNLVAYWPCEDGALSGQFASAVGGPALAISGTPQPAAFSGFQCSAPIPTFQSDSWAGQISAYAGSTSGQIRFLLATPAAGMADQTRIMVLSTAGTVTQVELRYGGTPSQGGLRLLAFDRTGTTLLDTGNVVYQVNGQNVRVSLQWTNSGGNLTFTLSTLAVGVGNGAGYITTTPIAQTINAATNVAFAPGGGLQGVSLGQVYIQSLSDDIFTLYNQLNAYVGESPTARLSRLCGEQGEQITITGASNQRMGAQLPGVFLDLLEECATADQGVLYDGVGPGLAYIARDARENRTATMTLHADTGQVAGDLTPVDDDQGVCNSFTASRPGGGSATYTDTSAQAGTGVIEVYDNSVTVNVQYDSQLIDVAGWRVNLGVANEAGYRYPQMDLSIAHNPEILASWLGVHVSDRNDITGIDTVLAEFPAGALSLMTEGWSETIDLTSWDITVNNTSYLPWRVGVLAADTGDVGEFLLRLDTDGAQTVGATAAGATTMTVATPSGPLWTTLADDFPFDVNAGGWQVTVTTITGSSSPQTFTVNPVPALIPANSDVSLWHPTVLAM